MFVGIASILSLYIILSLIRPLPFKILNRLLLSLMVILAVSGLVYLRFFFGGLGGIEAPRWLLLINSWFLGTMVFLFLLTIFRDLFWFFSLIGLKSSRLLRLRLKGPKTALILLLISIVLASWSLYHGSRVPDVIESEVVLEGLPAELSGLKLILLSDLHISRIFNRPWTEELVKRVNTVNPDLIIISGDLIDGSVDVRKNDIDPLNDLKSSYGIFACVGNHEYYSNIDQWLPIFGELSITVLNNQHVIIYPRGAPLVLAGLTDQTALEPRFQKHGPDLKKALNGLETDLPIILMQHRPIDARKNAEDKRIDLQLSGHTHGGMLPILKDIVKKVNQGFLSGWYNVGELKMYVSPGTALWGGFPFRLGVPGEITLITLKSSDSHPPQNLDVGTIK